MEEETRTVALSNVKRKRQSWFEMLKDAVMRAVRSRDGAHIVHRESPTKESSQTLCLSRYAPSTTKATARVKWLESKLDEIKSINDDPQSAWKSIKEINAGFSSHHEKAIVMKMKKKDGTFAKTEAENAKVLFNHFYGVVNCKELSLPSAHQPLYRK
jgi:hypothetical protein